jgi:hypothetical protein
MGGMDDATREPLLNAGEMARLLGVKPKWLRAEAQAKRIPACSAGDTYLFDPSIVERVLRKRARQIKREHQNCPPISTEDSQ